MLNNKSKKCSICNIEKEFSDFTPHKFGRFGLRSYCRTCQSIINKKYRLQNKERLLKEDLQRVVGLSNYIQKHKGAS